MLVPISFGVGAALTAAVGANVGADRHARARRIECAGAGVTLLITGILGAAVVIAPSLWLDPFTADPNAYAIGALYLVIAGPFYGLFGAGQAQYFASGGTGNILPPVSVTFAPSLIATIIGTMAISFGWGTAGLFIAIAIGLVVMGAEQAACLLGAGWRTKAPEGAGRPSR